MPSSHFQGWWTPLFSNPIQWLYFIFDWMKTCGKIRITSIIHNINNTLYEETLIRCWAHLFLNTPMTNRVGTNFSIVKKRNESGKASWMNHSIPHVWMKYIKEWIWWTLKKSPCKIGYIGKHDCSNLVLLFIIRYFKECKKTSLKSSDVCSDLVWWTNKISL